MTRSIAFLTTTWTFGIFLVSSALAEPPAGPEGDDVELDEVEIQGEIEKPKIFFILPRAQQETASQSRRIRFYPDILEPLDKDRFEEEARVLYQNGYPAE